MNARSKFAGFLFFSILLFSLAWTASPPLLVAQDIVVSAAVPDNAPQATLNLNVTIKGNGFKKGAIAKWLVTASETDTGGVMVNTTAYVSATELLANITVAPNAQTDKKFDIKVTLSSGRTGKGIELFRVIYSPPDPAIAYIVGNVWNGDLSVMNADGTNRLTLIKADRLYQYSQPSWSPDGSQLAFLRLYQGQGWIYVVNKDGSNLHQVVKLSDTAFADPQWSPAPLADGQYKILFRDQVVPGGPGDLFLVNLDGTAVTNLTNTTGDDEFYPTWNPTATRFAAQVYVPAPAYPIPMADIVVYDVAWVDGVFTATPSINLTDAGPLKDARVFSLDWANTQDKIVVEARFDYNNPSDFWVFDLDDPANPVRLTQTSGGSEFSPSWSADDSKIVYRRNWGTKREQGIFVINADGSGATGNTYPVDGYMPDWRRCCPTCVTVCAP
jgi:hypothetical protein